MRYSFKSEGKPYRFRYGIIMYLALLLPALSFAQSDNIALKSIYKVGEGITEYIPTGFSARQTPSLILQKEPVVVSPTAGDPILTPVFSRAATGYKATINFGKNVSMYGGGEVTGPLLRNNTSIQLWNTDNGAYERVKGQLYQSHPWVLGVRADGSSFGILFDLSWKSALNIGTEEVTLHSEGALFRLFILEGNTPQAVMRKLATLIGTIPMPPLWALGYHQCRFSYNTAERVQQIADTFRLKKIPCDAIWMDIDYMDGFRIFTFNPTTFPHPKAVNDYIHAKGFHSVWMIDPGVKFDSGYFVYKSGAQNNVWVNDQNGKEYHGNVWPGACSFPDFTRPDTRKWWAGLYKDFMAQGVDGVWNDMNEPAVFPEGLPEDQQTFTMPVTNIHKGGGDLPQGSHLLYHNAFGRLMVEATREGVLQANPDKRPFVLTRANLLGGQRYAATWTGDNAARYEHMELSIPMSLTLGLSGQPFSGPDIGGFLDNTSPDLWANWVGTGVFLPFARGHACAGTNNKEPWAFGDSVETVSRIAIERRYVLLPYLYTLFYESTKTGLPVMRPAFWADIKDTQLRGEEQTFLLGDKLLVIPYWAKDYHLPKGIWKDISLVEGDNSKFQATVKIKEGSIIPTGRIIQNTTENSLQPLKLFVCLNKQGTAFGDLYWDAGDGWGFRKGAYTHLFFKAVKKGKKVMVTIKKREGNFAAGFLKKTSIELFDGKTQRSGKGDLLKGIILRLP